MNRKQKIIVSIIGIVIVLLALVGLTYAYFLTQIKGNTNDKSISVTTAKLELIYGDGNGVLTPASKIEPGDKVKFLDKDGNTVESKTFTVTNNGNATVDDYGVVLENFSVIYYSDEVTEDENGNEVIIPAGTVTEFSRPEDFEFVITCKNQDGEECTGFNGTLPTQSEILIRNSIEKDEVQTYTATLTYKEAGVDQSADMNKTISGKFNIIGIGDTVDLTGEVTNYESGDYVQTNSTKRVSVIYPDGTYKVLGLEAGTHKIKVCAYNENEEIQDCTDEEAKMIQTLTINKGETSSVDNTSKTITITESSRLATVDINLTNSTINLGSSIVEDVINWHNAPTGTLLNALNSNNEVTSGVPSPSDLLDGKLSELKLYTSGLSSFTNLYNGSKYIVYAEEIDFETSSYKNINQCEIALTECQNAIKGKYAIFTSSSVSTDDKLNNYVKVNLNNYIDKILGVDDLVDNPYEPFYTNLYIPISVGIPQLRTIEDEYGMSYYFRGNGETNYVNFLDKCWRVLRVQGNGMIKLVLDDKDHVCDSELYQANNGSIGTADYGYIDDPGALPSSGNYIGDYLNTANRTTSMKYVLEDWYDKNISNNTSLVEKTKWCYQDFNNTAFNLKCNSNEYVESFIGTFTADELGLAVGNVFNSPDYVYKPRGYIYYNDKIRSLSKNSGYIIMYDQLVGHPASNAKANVIPVITIKSITPLSTTTTKSQNGTQENPYVID